MVDNLNQWLKSIPNDNQSKDRPLFDYSPTETVCLSDSKDALLKLINDAAVADSIERTANKLQHGGRESEDILECMKEFFAEVNLIVNFGKKLPSEHLSRSAIVIELKALSNTAKKLAKKTRELRKYAPGAASIAYLIKRYEAKSPSGFIRERKGFASGWRTPPLLGDILDAFYDDINEEIERLKVQIALQPRKIGGKNTNLRTISELLGNVSLSTLGENFPSLVNSIVNSTIAASEEVEVDSSTTRKRIVSSRE
jgi:hypothetical protein